MACSVPKKPGRTSNRFYLRFLMRPSAAKLFFIPDFIRVLSALIRGKICFKVTDHDSLTHLLLFTIYHLPSTA